MNYRTLENGITLNTVLSLPRMSKIAFCPHNCVKGIFDMMNQFFKPNFKMVEVGSFEGVSTLLFAMAVDTVYSVDCYDYKVPPSGRIPEHDQLFVEAERMFDARTKGVKNIIKIRKTSVEAAKDFEDGSLDAVYIDAEHDEESIREDIRVWRPKLKPGGILSGHDFILPYIERILKSQGLNRITVAPDTSWCVPIPKIDLVAVACTKVTETVEAMRKSYNQPLPFKFARKILFTHEDIELPDIEVIKINKLDYKQYNEFVAMDLWKWIGSEYVLLVQNDGYIKDGKLWDDNFLNYDYIGAPWPPGLHFTSDGTEVRVGNGGFSFRSIELLRAPTSLKLQFSDYGTGFWHEDGFLCNHNRKLLESCGLRFAPVDVAAKFSTELTVPETVESFGGHRYL